MIGVRIFDPSAIAADDFENTAGSDPSWET